MMNPGRLPARAHYPERPERQLWALAASVFFAGLAAGFLGGLCTILRPMQSSMDGRDFRNFMDRFLRYADNGLGKAFN
jgi:hypothetical protein